MAMQFRKATKAQAKLRMAIDGTAGSGKTFTALRVAAALVPDGRVAVIDTERGSASKYADLFAFDVLELDSFSPETYVDAIVAASREGYDVIIVDSLSHAWSGAGGALEIVDSHKDKFGGGWRKVTPMHNALVDTVLRAPAHVICTMRTKMEYILEEVIKNGNKTQVPRKVAMKPIQREGMEYEFDVVGDIDADHALTVSKTRCPALTDKVFAKPGEDLAGILRGWLSDGTAPVAPAPALTRPAPTMGDHRDPNAESDAFAALADEFIRRIGQTLPADLEALAGEIKASGLPPAHLARVRTHYVAAKQAATSGAAA